MPSSLVNRNVTINGHRTSVRLERKMWEALEEIARREGRSINDICSQVEGSRQESTLTAGLRVFLLSYYREAAEAAGC